VLGQHRLRHRQFQQLLRDAGYFGTPVVLVGNRQEGRENDTHVTRITPTPDDVFAAASAQLARGRYTPSTLYGDGYVSGRIAQALSELEPYVQKTLHYIYDAAPRTAASGYRKNEQPFHTQTFPSSSAAERSQGLRAVFAALPPHDVISIGKSVLGGQQIRRPTHGASPKESARVSRPSPARNSPTAERSISALVIRAGNLSCCSAPTRCQSVLIFDERRGALRLIRKSAAVDACSSPAFASLRQWHQQKTPIPFGGRGSGSRSWLGLGGEYPTADAASFAARSGKSEIRRAAGCHNSSQCWAAASSGSPILPRRTSYGNRIRAQAAGILSPGPVRCTAPGFATAASSYFTSSQPRRRMDAGIRRVDFAHPRPASFGLRALPPNGIGMFFG